VARAIGIPARSRNKARNGLRDLQYTRALSRRRMTWGEEIPTTVEVWNRDGSGGWDVPIGVDVAKINFLVIPDEQAEQTLVTGNTDLAIIHAPFSGRADHADQLVRLWSDYDLDGGLGGMAPYSAHGKFIREHPEAVRDVVVALAKAGNWVNANPEEARKLVSQRIHMAIENVDRYAYVEDLVVTERSVEKVIHSIFMKLGLTWEPAVHKRVKAVILYLAESDRGQRGSGSQP